MSDKKPGAATKNPHAHPLVLSGGGRCWVECRCGWLSASYPSTQGASAAWAAHVGEVVE